VISYIIPLLGSFFDGDLFGYVFVYIIALAFLCTVPSIIRSFWSR
jgi:hypothetical protein